MTFFPRRFQFNPTRTNGPRHRRLRYETCESRALLTALTVTSSADAGPGSFRNAIAQANANPAITEINFAPSITTIQLNNAVRYSGGQSLSIDGNDAVIRPFNAKEGLIDLFLATGGADISLSELTFRNGKNGVVITTPAGVTGDVNVNLDQVTISHNELFGLHVDDLTNASAASIVLDIAGSNILANGTGAHDQDGVRVDERGDGSIVTRITNSHLNENGAEGIELDEAGDGRVELNVNGSTFNGNGFISSGDPEDPDFDDGIDIDEADLGSVFAAISNSTVSGNFDEGIDLNEDGFGDLNVLLSNVIVNGNTDEGVALEEAGAGDINVLFSSLSSQNNGASGILIEEFDAGDVSGDIANSMITGNGGFGIEVAQAAPGKGIIRLRNVTLRNNADGAFDAVGAQIIKVS
jgi:hypothetical protein